MAKAKALRLAEDRLAAGAEAKAKALTNKEHNPSDQNNSNPSPFENFELALLFPSCGFWFIFL
ncbi:MAG TPA: hypothetical protein VN854_00495, partial [Mycoplasmatales bacterium]|nr:hypothetical protein [Mycoplasmatales bacterium]